MKRWNAAQKENNWPIVERPPRQSVDSCKFALSSNAHKSDSHCSKINLGSRVFGRTRESQSTHRRASPAIQGFAQWKEDASTLVGHCNEWPLDVSPFASILYSVFALDSRDDQAAAASHFASIVVLVFGGGSDRNAPEGASAAEIVCGPRGARGNCAEASGQLIDCRFRWEASVWAAPRIGRDSAESEAESASAHRPRRKNGRERGS